LWTEIRDGMKVLGLLGTSDNFEEVRIGLLGDRDTIIGNTPIRDGM